MELGNRVIRTIYRPGQGLLVADIVGRLHQLDDDLNVVRSSPVLADRHPFYALAVTDEWIVGKDRLGNIARWRADTLDLVDLLDAAATCDPSALLPDEEPSILIARGITVWRDKVYVNNGFLQLVVIDLPTFRVERIVASPTGDVPIEWICTEHPDVQAVSDKNGRLFLGNLDTLEFPTVVKVDEKNSLHRVRYDRRHDRFWVTQDAGIGDFSQIANGVVTVSTKGVLDQELRFALDDVECLDFSPDGTEVYVGGFDGVLQVFDNTAPALRITRTYGPFSHQLSDLAIHPDGSVYVLTHDGELLRMDREGRVLARLAFRRQCVWDIRRSLADPDQLLCATDEGVTVLRVVFDDSCGLRLEEVSEHRHGRGFTRRVVPVPDGWVGITRDQRVIRGGQVAWDVGVPSLIHNVAVSPDFRRVLVATNDGAIEFDAATGAELERFGVGAHTLWACCYLETGERVLATHGGDIVVLDAGGTERSPRLSCENYPKRMWQRGDALFVTGGGGLREVALDGSGVRRHWHELLSNTCENAVLVGDVVYAVTYDAQIAAYWYESGELIGLVENLPDIPKGVTSVNGPDGTPYLVIGGRSGYVTVYRVAKDGTITRQRDHRVARSGSPSAPSVGCVAVSS